MSTPLLDQLSLQEQRELRQTIDRQKEKIEEKKRYVESLESRLNEKNFAHRSLENPGGSINDVSEREELLRFFSDKLGRYGYQRINLGLFDHYSNPLTMCEQYDIEAPKWYLDKYCNNNQ